MLPTPPSARPTAALAVVVPLLAAVVLYQMGRTVWCDCGSLSPWSWDIWSSHNSQHLLDPYTFTHVLHGVAFFGALSLAGERLTMRWRVIVMLALESAWEIAENTEAVIQKYREATISLDYYGDSVLNSMADVAACGLGFAIASRLPWWASLSLFVGVELVLAAWIRDSLMLNVLMLVWPIEAVKVWQSGV